MYIQIMYLTFDRKCQRCDIIEIIKIQKNKNVNLISDLGRILPKLETKYVCIS